MSIGSQVGTEVTVLRAEVTLTDEEIKALPTTPVVIVPATETLDYSGLPTKIFFPLAMVISINAEAGAYSNLDATPQFILAMGSDWSVDALQADNNIAHLQDAASSIGVANTFQRLVVADIILPLFINGGAIFDNALAIVINNGSNGDLTGGNAANSMKVTVLYVEITP